MIDQCTAEVALREGKYHQIKRMFGRFGNRVLKLHRIAVGKLMLDPALSPGDYRELTGPECRGIAHSYRP